MNDFQLTAFADDDQLAKTVAASWLKEVPSTRFVGLSGGRITKKFFSAVVELTKTNQVEINSVHFFWADERCVPPDNTDSNFADAQKFLFESLRISEKQIHRIRGEDPPDVAAKKATDEISSLVPGNAEGQPVLDLILLGMGEDGHVASLFPGEPETMITDKAIYRAVKNSPKPPPNRVTLGYPTIAVAKQVWVLVSGKGKENALRESLSPIGKTPLARVLQQRTHSRVFSDMSLK